MKTTKLSFFLPLSSLFLTFLTLLAVLSANAQVPSYVPTNGLVGYWPFNGNANDASVNGNDGTVNEAALIADRFGSLNSAYSFDGINDFIQTPNQALPGSVSFSGWYNMSSFNNPYNDMFYVSHQSPSSDFYSTNIAFGYRSYQGQYGHSTYAQSPLTGYYPTDNLPSINVWHHITCVFENGSYVRMYLDGSLFYTSNNVVTNSSQASLPLLFGGTGTNSLYYYSGGLDDIGIWNRALTADEVLALYNGCNVTPQVVAGNTTPGAFANSTYTCNSTAGSTYTWTVNNGVVVSGQGTNSVIILWGAEGVGSVSVAETTADGCVGDEVIYDVNVQCVVSGNEITGPVGPEAFSNSTYTCNGAANSTYNWTVTNGVIAIGQGTNSVTILWGAEGVGSVSVIETTAEGCVGTTLSQDVVVIPTNVEEFSNAMILYPNPVSTNLTLQVKNEMIGSDFVVFDALGKVVLRDKILSNNQDISVNNLSNGNYILRVGAMNKVFTISK